MKASAPLVFELAGLWWPYGPARVEVELRDREGADHRSRLRLEAGGHELLVDATLPAPADEGLLRGEAEALRGMPPAAPVELLLRGPRAPWPGADVAARTCLILLLSRRGSAPPPPPTSPAEDACRTARAVDRGGCRAAPDSARVALLDATLLLYRDPVAAASQPEPAPGGLPGAGLFDAEPEGALLERLRSRAQGPANERERDLLEALAAAGLIARWPLGGGVDLALAAPGRREELEAALVAHGLEPRPCRLRDVGAARIEAWRTGAEER